MKKNISYLTVMAVLFATLTIPSWADAPVPGYVDFGKLTPSTTGGEFVEVNIQSNLIGLATRFVEKQEPDVAQLLHNLKNVRVNVIGLDDKNREEMEKCVKGIRSQLETDGWQRVVTAQQKNEDVGVYIKTKGDESIEGVVVTVLEQAKQVVLVNIVGNIKPEQISQVGERFGIDPLKKMGESFPKKDASAK
jgi:hypothetical protein